MSRIAWFAFALIALVAAPSAAGAGWVIEWKNTPLQRSGPQSSETSTARIAGNKSRVEQSHLTTIYDYGRGTFTVMNPKLERFWTGSIDEYVRISVRRRNEALSASVGGKPADKLDELPPLDEKELPQITIERSGEQREIAGYETVKYVVKVGEELFQEIWLAESLDLTADVNPQKFMEFQRRNSRGMIGGSAKPFNALYRSPEYMKLLKSGFALSTTTHHLAGGFEQTAKSIRQADVAPSEFAVPENYRRVQLNDVFEFETE